MCLPIRTVIIKVTNECNIRCAYCFVEPSAPRKVKISESIVRRLLTELDEHSTESTVHLVWHGGEPTLAGESFFCRMKEVQTGFSKKFVNMIQTNGTLLTDSYVSVLKQLGFHIGLSLDGPQSLNDLARVDKKGNGTFAIVENSINILRKHEISFGILATVARHNVHDAETLYNFCKEHKVPLKLSPLYHSGLAKNNIDSLAISIEEYSSFTDKLARLWLEDENPVKIDPIESLLMRVLGSSTSIGCAFSENCHHHFLGVGPTGDLYPCGMFQGFSKFCYGNIFSTSLSDIGSHKVFRSMEDHSKMIDKKCAPCAIHEQCNGGCPFHAMANTGSLNKRTPLCWPYKESVATIIDSMATRLQQAH